VKKDEFFCEGCHRFRKKVKGFLTLGPVNYSSHGQSVDFEVSFCSGKCWNSWIDYHSVAVNFGGTPTGRVPKSSPTGIKKGGAK
jgi:hypothetical protein